MNLIVQLRSGEKILIIFFLYSSEVFELPATHISAGKCDGVILAVKKRKDSLRTVQKAITDIKKKECELMGIVLYS
ncbi:conserved domain protein [Bacillus anthracis str. Sterne]|nr:conserved domain protein [Bacillus anthracis str. Sterne]EVT93407.1 Tyrosine-protein kinase (Capsular polysaccharide biosynthesis) [Bacillus anthracis 8903-G]EVU04855.1 Tyrosine-protein kinase (Capsular polysaccharide biosynthesis) [Bacillus anthracis 52-G]